MIKGILRTLITSLIFLTQPTFAKSIDETEESLKARVECWEKYPDWVFDYFKREACVELRTYQIKKQIDEAAAMAKAAQAELDNRTCLREFIGQTEKVINSIKIKLNDRMTFDQAIAVIRTVANFENIEIKNLPGQTRFIAFSFEAKCPTNMIVTVNIREDMVAHLSALSVVVSNEHPQFKGLSDRLSTNYLLDRINRTSNESAARLIAEKKEEANKVEMVNASMICGRTFGWCELTFGIKNNAKFALKEVSISFDVFPKDGPDGCPANPSARGRVSFTEVGKSAVNPGQTEWRTEQFQVPNALWVKGINFCSKIVSAEFL